MKDITKNDDKELYSRFRYPSSQEEYDIAKAELIRRNIIDKYGDLKED